MDFDATHPYHGYSHKVANPKTGLTGFGLVTACVFPAERKVFSQQNKKE